MAQEDQNQTQKCSNSSGNLGRSSKKQKQNKIPQRGLGVAQLEKIRLEEEHKKDAAVATKSCSSYLPFPIIPNFHLSNQPNPSIPAFSSNPPPDFRPPIPNFHHCDFEKESCLVDPGLAFRSSTNMPCELSPTWHIPNWAQKPQYQQPCSSLVNLTSGNSSIPILHYMMEPPSNQNYGGSCTPMRPDEKMICMKRPYPFSFDVPPAPSFNFKLPTISAALRPNEATSGCIGTAFNLDADNSTFSREAPTSSVANSEPNSIKSNKESGNFNGDFLTLAPPTPASCTPTKSKSPSTPLTFQNQEYQDFESPSSQGVLMSDQIPPPLKFSHHFNQQQPFYSFFPPSAMAKSSLTAAMIENCSSDQVGRGSVDLNLKL